MIRSSCGATKRSTNKEPGGQNHHSSTVNISTLPSASFAKLGSCWVLNSPALAASSASARGRQLKFSVLGEGENSRRIRESDGVVNAMPCAFRFVLQRGSRDITSEDCAARQHKGFFFGVPRVPSVLLSAEQNALNILGCFTMKKPLSGASA